MDAQNYETWLENKDKIGEFYDARVTLEQSHALEEIERLELFIAQAGMKIEEMEAQIQSGTSVSFSTKFLTRISWIPTWTYQKFWFKTELLPK